MRTGFIIAENALGTLHADHGCPGAQSAHGRIDFMSNHARHLLHNRAAFKTGEFQSSGRSLFGKTLTFIHRLSEFPRAAPHQRMKPQFIQYEEQQKPGRRQYFAKVPFNECTGTHILQISIGTDFQVLQKPVDIRMRNVCEPLIPARISEPQERHGHIAYRGFRSGRKRPQAQIRIKCC